MCEGIKLHMLVIHNLRQVTVQGHFNQDKLHMLVIIDMTLFSLFSLASSFKLPKIMTKMRVPICYQVVIK